MVIQVFFFFRTLTSNSYLNISYELGLVFFFCYKYHHHHHLMYNDAVVVYFHIEVCSHCVVLVLKSLLLHALFCLLILGNLYLAKLLPCLHFADACLRKSNYGTQSPKIWSCLVENKKMETVKWRTKKNREFGCG